MCVGLEAGIAVATHAVAQRWWDRTAQEPEVGADEESEDERTVAAGGADIPGAAATVGVVI